MEKKKGVIERVDLQGVNTYDDESFEPSLINTISYSSYSLYINDFNVSTIHF